MADPLAGDAPLRNGASLRGAIVVFARGRVTFAAKALAAQAVGAAAVLVTQTADVWPYVMRDSTSESDGGGGTPPLAIPVLMISRHHGQHLVARLRSAAAPTGTSGGGAARATLRVRDAGLECPVCQEAFVVGAAVLRMPCQHAFHRDCLLPWLKQQSTCPTCRTAIATDDPDFDRGRQRERQRAIDEASADPSWGDWFA